MILVVRLRIDTAIPLVEATRDLPSDFEVPVERHQHRVEEREFVEAGTARWSTIALRLGSIPTDSQ
jgi:hypothetical protein